MRQYIQPKGIPDDKFHLDMIKLTVTFFDKMPEYKNYGVQQRLRLKPEDYLKMIEEEN